MSALAFTFSWTLFSAFLITALVWTVVYFDTD